MLPAPGGYALHPEFNVKAKGRPTSWLLDLDVQSEAGNVRGQVTADVKAPDSPPVADVDVERLNLAPILKEPGAAQRHHRPRRRSICDSPARPRRAGRRSHRGIVHVPRTAVAAAGYQARDVKATGTFAEGPHHLDALPPRYGGTGTAKGFVGPRRRDGRSRSICAAAPTTSICETAGTARRAELATDCRVAEYHVAGRARRHGHATLNRSTVEGATLAEGTAAEFKTGADGVATRRAGRIGSRTCRGSAGFSRSRRSTSRHTTAG